MGTTFIGEIRTFGFGFAPKGWAQCNGQSLAIAQNQALFSILGTTYGGNGVTTFQLPNLQGRVPNHFSGSYPLGATAGSADVTLTIGQIPTHVHALNAIGGTPGARSLAGNQLGVPTFTMYGPSPGGSFLAPGALGTNAGGAPHANLQPYLVLNICICLQGFFPSRN